MAGVSFVYAFGREDHPTKVGMTSRPTFRLRELNFVRRERLAGQYFGQWPREQAAAIEQAAHRALLSHRIKGDWFSVSVEQGVEAIQTATAELGFAITRVAAASSSAGNRKPLRDNPDARCEDIRIRLHEEEKRAFQEAAEAAGQTLSDWLRQVARKAVGLSRKEKRRDPR